VLEFTFAFTRRNFPRQRTFWSFFRNNAHMSMGITQIAAVMGSCVLVVLIYPS
jgi:acetyl-CoA carboxylase carboxyltransferase component